MYIPPQIGQPQLSVSGREQLLAASGVHGGQKH